MLGIATSHAFRGLKVLAFLCSTTLLAGIATAQTAAPSIDYQATFAAKFPATAGGHRITDWDLYAALTSNDLLGYAVAIDPVRAARREEVRGRAYQTQTWQDDIKRDPLLRAAFDGERVRLAAMQVYLDSDGDAALERCPRPVSYIDKEFRILLGGSIQNADPLASATVAPACRPTPAATFQITAGRSYRFTCWPGPYGKDCGWRLPDMPESLKRIIETDYPMSIKLRWHWRGVNGVARIRSIDANGNRMAERDSVVATVPVDLGLDFVDGNGRILWTANAARARGASSATPLRLRAITVTAAQ
jgi:hypothetical protein